MNLNYNFQTGTVESFYYLKNNTMVTFSEQQLVDCDYHSEGCWGGYEDLALGYIQEYGNNNNHYLYNLIIKYQHTTF